MNQLPTLREELDRKAFATIDWLTTAFDQGRLTNDQYAAGLEALFMAVSGLVDEDIVNLITMASGIAGAPIAMEKRHFVKGGLLVTLARVGGEEEFHVTLRDSGVSKGVRSRAYDTPKQAREGMRAYANKLLEMGYAEV